jgi:hypothetical protein
VVTWLCLMLVPLVTMRFKKRFLCIPICDLRSLSRQGFGLLAVRSPNPLVPPPFPRPTKVSITIRFMNRSLTLIWNMWHHNYVLLPSFIVVVFSSSYKILTTPSRHLVFTAISFLLSHVTFRLASAQHQVTVALRPEATPVPCCQGPAARFEMATFYWITVAVC